MGRGERQASGRRASRRGGGGRGRFGPDCALAPVQGKLKTALQGALGNLLSYCATPSSGAIGLRRALSSAGRAPAFHLGCCCVKTPVDHGLFADREKSVPRSVPRIRGV